MRWLLTILVVLSATYLEAQIRVAAVGNSITYGYGVFNREKNAYPSQLQSILGSEYEVRNFGVSGRTLLKKGNYPYWDTPQYKEALAFMPNVVIIKLGTNDSKVINRKHLTEFKKDYLELVRSFKELESDPRVILCLPVPVFSKDTVGITASVVSDKIIPLIKEVAYESQTEVIDLYSLFLDKKRMIPDGVHPNALGATLISNRLYEHIIQKEEPGYDLIKNLGIRGEESGFHGYRQLLFDRAGVETRIVQPVKTAVGRPWVLRARFWGHEPQADIALLERGFHIVYCDVSDLYGSPEAVERWNNLYAFMRKGGLSEKVVLEGMSRGGLIVYNWAAVNPEKVAAIYADAPVLDPKSWPGGKGSAKKSEADWQRLMKAYGFESEEEVLRFDGFPIHRAQRLAEAGIPLLHVCGEADKVVPVAENTREFEQEVIRFGGDIKTIYKENVGHHPHSLVDLTAIVNFILRATGYKLNMATIPVPGAEFRSAAGWKEGADWWANHKDITDQLTQTKGELDVLFIGNSITQGMGGNREVVTYKPGKSAFDLALSGHTWETAGISGDRTQHVLWRIQHGDYRQANPKVVVLTIGVNNFPDDEPLEVAAGISKIIAALRQYLPDTKILLLGPLPAGNNPEHVYRQKYLKVHEQLKQQAGQWQVRYLDMGEALIMANGVLNPDYYGTDGIHLFPNGYKKWAEVLQPVLDEMIKQPTQR